MTPHLLLLMFAACTAGPPAAVDVTYNGSAIYSVRVSLELASERANLRGALLWTSAEQPYFPLVIHQAYVAADTQIVDSPFFLDLQSEAPSEYRHAFGPGLEYAVGFVLAYVDCNGSKQLEREARLDGGDCGADSRDVVVAVADTSAVLFLRADATERTPFADWLRVRSTVPAGYSTAELRARSTECTNAFGTPVRQWCHSTTDGEPAQQCTWFSDCERLRDANGISDPMRGGVCALNGGMPSCRKHDAVLVALNGPPHVSLREGFGLNVIRSSDEQPVCSTTVCAIGEQCVDGVCVEVCTGAFPNGVCRTGKSCLYGWSQLALCIEDGTLPARQACDAPRQCVSGKCRDIAHVGPELYPGYCE